MSDLAQSPTSTSRVTAARQLRLPDIALFEGVPENTLSQISDDMVSCFCTGTEIVRENDTAGGLVVLLQGQARVLCNGTYLETRRTGEIIGEQAILDRTPRTATVIADGMVKALVVPSPVVQSLLRDPTFALNIARVLSAKLRQATAVRSVRYRDEERLFVEFSAHVSPQVASWLLSKGSSYGDPRFVDATVLMADVRSFTEKSFRMEPKDIASDLSSYLDATVQVIHRFEGFVDKFIGDAVLAVWGITPSDANLTAQAFECACQMVKTAETLRFGGDPIQIGVGLEHGRVFVGNVGGDGKRQFTVLGTSVNLASRYQNECKALGSSIVLGSSAYSALPERVQKHLRHDQRSIKGVGFLDVYSWPPGAQTDPRTSGEGKTI